MQFLPSEPVWLPAEVIISYNKQHVAQTGENHAVLFPEKLDGALQRPITSWHYNSNHDAVSLAVICMEAIASAHAFEQGNKRTAFDAGFVFLMANGYELLEEADQDIVAVAFIELIERKRNAASFEALLKEFVVPR
ncbi:type II toxin-antitoxin system death-on-curing family toxin [Agrobacterium rosae]|uniref:type II toxin-antitoxin system death-on-curing family toxin n=1 Tax=Agrobacterium rosae TaxID=1972867 RepID=UPI002A0DC0F5|nr:type II toxin-antitoxin system death-on-curing family toxin [Agrobacterium rosae]MDX8315319.1 type II toxin-antitoxin system death-on-curing family toxin [Agrobacterium rosae]